MNRLLSLISPKANEAFADSWPHPPSIDRPVDTPSDNEGGITQSEDAGLCASDRPRVDLHASITILPLPDGTCIRLEPINLRYLSKDTMFAALNADYSTLKGHPNRLKIIYDRWVGYFKSLALVGIAYGIGIHWLSAWYEIPHLLLEYDETDDYVEIDEALAAISLFTVLDASLNFERVTYPFIHYSDSGSGREARWEIFNRPTAHKVRSPVSPVSGLPSVDQRYDELFLWSRFHAREDGSHPYKNEDAARALLKYKWLDGWGEICVAKPYSDLVDSRTRSCSDFVAWADSSQDSEWLDGVAKRFLVGLRLDYRLKSADPTSLSSMLGYSVTA
jgi:hypothetical protein